jgi:hypothetical protein
MAAERIVEVPGPIHWQYMEVIDKNTDATGAPPYPILTENEKKELQAGTDVFVSVLVEPASADKYYTWVPGKVAILEGKLGMQPIPTNWASLGMPQVRHIEFVPETKVRFTGRPAPPRAMGMAFNIIFGGEEPLMSKLMELLKTMYDNDANFKKNIDTAKPKVVENQEPISSEDLPRLKFLALAARECIKTTSCPNAWWVQRPGNYNAFDDDYVEGFKENVVASVLNQMTSACLVQEMVADFKKSMGVAKTNCKHVCELLDRLSKEALLVELPAPESASGAGQFVLPLPRGMSTDMQTAFSSQSLEISGLRGMLTQVMTSLKSITGRMETMDKQAKIKEAIVDHGIRASHINIKKDHSCGYQFMQTVADGARGLPIDMSVEKAEGAKATVLWYAKLEFTKDHAMAKAIFEADSYTEYMARLMSPPASYNWKGSVEGLMFVKNNPTIELRTLYYGADNKVLMDSTLGAEESPRQNVGFSLLADGHHDLGCIIKKGFDGKEENQYVFTTTEAPRVQRLLEEYMIKNKKVGTKINVAPPSPILMDGAEETLEEFRKVHMKFMAEGRKTATDDSVGGMDWEIVAGKDKEARARKAKETEDTKASAEAAASGKEQLQAELTHQEMQERQQKEIQQQTERVEMQQLKLLHQQRMQLQAATFAGQKELQQRQQQMHQVTAQAAVQQKEVAEARQRQEQRQMLEQEIANHQQTLQQQQQQLQQGMQQQQQQMQQGLGVPQGAGFSAIGAQAPQTQQQQMPHQQQQGGPQLLHGGQPQQQGGPYLQQVGAQPQQGGPHLTSYSQALQGAPWGGNHTGPVQIPGQAQGAWTQPPPPLHTIVPLGPMAPWQMPQQAGSQAPAMWGQKKKGQAMQGGERVVPAVVCFGESTEANHLLKWLRYNIGGPAVSAITSIQKAQSGRPRSVLHCKESQLQLVQTLVGAISNIANGPEAKVYVRQGGGLTSASKTGLAGAAKQAGICRYFAAGQICPHGAGCIFQCY